MSLLLPDNNQYHEKNIGKKKYYGLFFIPELNRNCCSQQNFVFSLPEGTGTMIQASLSVSLFFLTVFSTAHAVREKGNHYQYYFGINTLIHLLREKGN